MASNTKLTQDQKDTLKYWKKDNPDAVFFNNGVVTACIMQEFSISRMYRVTLSTMSPDENKFRNKVGQYFAFDSMDKGKGVLMNINTLYDFLDNAMMLNNCDYADLDKLGF